MPDTVLGMPVAHGGRRTDVTKAGSHSIRQPIGDMIYVGLGRNLLNLFVAILVPVPVPFPALASGLAPSSCNIC
jgi:hypothetical protein